MLKRCLSITVAGLLICTGGLRLANAESSEEKQVRFIGRLKEGITKLGTGPEARVKIKLRDKTKLEGYVSEAAEEHFTVLDSNTGKATKVAFSQVSQVKGNNLSKGTKIAITIAAVLVIGVLMIIGAPKT